MFAYDFNSEHEENGPLLTMRVQYGLVVDLLSTIHARDISVTYDHLVVDI